MRRVSFIKSDIEGRAALLISIVNNAGVDGPPGLESLQTIKLFHSELAEAEVIASHLKNENISPADYHNIRECLGHLIGRTIEDIVQHDHDEFTKTNRSYIQLLLSDGDYLKIFVGPYGFQYSKNGDDDPDI